MQVKDVLGYRCKNRITGEEGVVIGVIDWFFGCRVLLTQPSKKKKAQYGQRSRPVSPNEIEIIDEEPVSGILDDIPSAFFDEAEKQDPFFGATCRDVVTGYEGVCIGKTLTIFSEVQYNLQAKVDKKGSVPDDLWIDKGRLRIVEGKEKIEKAEVTTSRAGGVDSMPDFW